MNNKEMVLHKIVDIVVECCRTKIDEDTYSITREDVLGHSKKANVVMTRSILCSMLDFAGYSRSTAADLLKISESAVRHLSTNAIQVYSRSRAYKLAEAESLLKCRDYVEGF